MFAASKTAAVSTGGVSYIEDVFSTYLYTGNGTTQTITNGVDLSTKGGLVWIKSRTFASNNALFDTARGSPYFLQSNTTTAQTNGINEFGSFTSTGFTVPNNTVYGNTNYLTYTYASWTFRKQPKFFDIVTWTGDGVTTGRTIAHSLGSAVGALFVKCTSNPSDWPMWHNTFTSLQGMYLNTTGSKTVNTFESKFGNGTTVVAPTSTVFTVGIDNNVSGRTYVAYLFAHNAGGFGLTGTDNVISCGSFTHNSTSGVDVNLGYEPQWILQKNSGAASGWLLIDNMRGWTVDSNDQYLTANSSGVEDNIVNGHPTATGFKVDAGAWGNGANIIYIAIRRGPMKVPTTGTSVFSPVAQNASNPTSTVTTNFPVDFTISAQRSKAQSLNTWVLDRLRGSSKASGEFLKTNVDGSQQTLVAFGLDNNSGYVDNFWGNATDGVGATSSIAYWNFKRAPSFMDVVCYTGTGANRTVTHNLGVVPELMIVKQRNTARDWAVYTSVTAATNFMYLNATDASGASNTMWNDTTPTSSVFTVGTNLRTNVSAGTYVAYLFATCAGVSKVGSYTGNGTTQTIDCGLTAGARFVLIKRTDAVGDWYVYDTARGMTTLTDPYLLTNTTAAEVATLGSVTTVATGFAVNSAILAAINTNAATYIFLAIA